MELEAGSHGSVYQVSYLVENAGKMFKNSKNRITWNFVANGGSREHYVVLTWSKTTGKQEIKMDGETIWFGRNKGRSVLDHNWTTSDESLKLHVLATCAPKMNTHFRSYDLLINGQLFALLPSYNDRNDSYGDATEIGWVAQNNNNNSTNHLNSIMQILYPKGYIPPVDKNQQQERQELRGTVEQDSNVVAQVRSFMNKWITE